MEVKLIDHIGSDNLIIKIAKEVEPSLENLNDLELLKKIEKINWHPFAHTCVTFHIKMPIFVARQLGKHQVGLSWNEISRRYVDYEPEFYNPEFWRGRSESVKQGSSTTKTINYDIQGYNINCLKMYENLLSQGIAPEMARMVLPQNMMTEIYWTSNLYGFARVYNLRTEKTAQWETQQIAIMIGEHMEKLFPVSWKALIL